MTRTLNFLILIFLATVSLCQDTLKTTTPVRDSSWLRDLFLQSKLEVSARTVYMTTINEGALKDDYALGSGAGVGITTKSFYGFQFALSSFVVYNLWSSDLTQIDPATKAPNRYEIGLFDLQRLNVKNNLIRMENLFLKYHVSKTSIMVGKMKLNTPFLNPQDGRMNATMEEGVWVNSGEFKKIKINGGWIWGISPRSTTQWFSVANSMGIYPSGVTETGVKSNYAGYISSSGIAIGNMVIQPNEKIKINWWDILIDNVMNTSMLEINIESGKKLKFYQGAMLIHQDAINDGGNEDTAKTYIAKGARSNAISAQAGIKSKRYNININYTRITAEGRYLFPREWGRDPFYTFMLREKNDGFGDVHAITTKATFTFLNEKLKASGGYGYFQMPDVMNYRLSKYGMPSYHQVNLDLTYSFSKFLKGMDIRCIGVYKRAQGNTYGNLKYVYNKVNMANISFVVDFRL